MGSVLPTEFNTEAEDWSSHLIRKPLPYSGSLDEYENFPVTPVIGVEFPTLQVADILGDDKKIRDLAILASRKGVIFFRNQTLTIPQQKLLAQKLGELTGKPSTSKLSKHVVYNSRVVNDAEAADDEVAVNTSEVERKYNPHRFTIPRPMAAGTWHSDVAYEKVPADYTVLHIVDIPDGSGGDTLWACAYEMYHRLSPPIRALADGLTAWHTQKESYDRMVRELKFELNVDRGAPENTGLDLASTHPLVRTNPVTGWRSLFAGASTLRDGWIEGVTKPESDMLKQYFHALLVQNHDLQVRFKWGKNDLAVWDNRSTYHTATFDHDGHRTANRVSSLGELPYFDPFSKSKHDALALEI